MKNVKSASLYVSPINSRFIASILNSTIIFCDQLVLVMTNRLFSCFSFFSVLFVEWF
jgi:hypothetical protein